MSLWSKRPSRPSTRQNALKVVTAESCTGGLIATVLSEAPGAAEHFDGSFVTSARKQMHRAQARY
ncbi:MAG: CinA family protein [Methylibium sp.]